MSLGVRLEWYGNETASLLRCNFHTLGDSLHIGICSEKESNIGNNLLSSAINGVMATGGRDIDGCGQRRRYREATGGSTV